MKGKKYMVRINIRITKILIATAMLALAALTIYGHSHANNPNVSMVVFFVGWYDVGQAALDGLNGVKRVEKGFRGFRETNTVYYDSSVIKIEEMEAALKKAGTYRGTAK